LPTDIAQLGVPISGASRPPCGDALEKKGYIAKGRQLQESTASGCNLSPRHVARRVHPWPGPSELMGAIDESARNAKQMMAPR